MGAFFSVIPSRACPRDIGGLGIQAVEEINRAWIPDPSYAFSYGGQAGSGMTKKKKSKSRQCLQDKSHQRLAGGLYSPQLTKEGEGSPLIMRCFCFTDKKNDPCCARLHRQGKNRS